MLFDKLDRGDSWDDDFELNTVLQVQFYQNLYVRRICVFVILSSY